MCEKQCLWRVSVCHIIENLSERVSLCLYNTLRFPAKAWQIPTIFLYSLSSVSLLIKNHSGSPFLSYPITYSCSLLELLSFPSTRVSIVLEYSRSLRICSPLYLIIQDPRNMNNPKKVPKSVAFSFFFLTAVACWSCSPSTILGCMIVEYSRSLRTCSPLYLIIQDPQNMNNPPKNSIVSFLSNMDVLIW